MSESKVRYLVMKHQVRRGVQDGVVTVVGAWEEVVFVPT